MKNLKAEFGVGIFRKSVELKDVLLVSETSWGDIEKISLDEFLIKLEERVKKLEAKGDGRKT